MAEWLGFKWQEAVKEIWGNIQNGMTGFCFKFKAPQSLNTNED